jgi:hypothetical protein
MAQTLAAAIRICRSSPKRYCPTEQVEKRYYATNA